MQHGVDHERCSFGGSQGCRVAAAAAMCRRSRVLSPARQPLTIDNRNIHRPERGDGLTSKKGMPVLIVIKVGRGASG